jgi:SIR2-like domain
MIQPSPKLNEVAKLLDLSRPPLLVVVGAGVSIGATGLPQASWLGLLKYGITYLVQRRFQKDWGLQLEGSLEAAFSPFNLKSALQHAELVEQALNTPDATAFAEWLASSFSSFKAKANSRDTLEALRDLQEAGALLLTTNYDDLVSDITNSPPVTWEEHTEFLRVITRQKAGILHIHGHWQRPSSIVLARIIHKESPTVVR